MRPPLPPFTAETAAQKVRAAEDGWNTRNAEKVALAYSENSAWRNRSQFIKGRDAITAFLKDKWANEGAYRLVKELFAFEGNHIAVRFAYEYQNAAGDWFRAYGNENWVFDKDGLMAERHASINDVPISNEQRWFHWPQGIRPADSPSLSEFEKADGGNNG